VIVIIPKNHIRRYLFKSATTGMLISLNHFERKN